MERTLLDYLWIVVASGLVFLMQAGFAMVESGLTRTKNSINVSIKNLTDLGVSVLFFWLFGFALMFGQSFQGLAGSSHFFVQIATGSGIAWTSVFFLFQAMFCSTAATIVSGAVAERMKYSSYIISTILLSAIIYPIFGHWSWGSFYLESTDSQGWLESLGFIDFAGSTVVHSVGGWIALAALVIIGPRTGRFTSDGKAYQIPGSNIPMVVLGVLLLWFGWFGFNGGSTLEFNTDVAVIIANTTLAAASGMIGSLALGWVIYKIPTVGLVLNGSLAGLVAITASAHVVTGGQSIIIGIVGGFFMLLSTMVLEKMKIDDAVGAIPVHLAAGIWGTLAVALFGDPLLLGTGLTQMEQLGIQALGVTIAGLWSFSTAFLFLWVVNKISPLRVSKDHEYQGLNVTEHGASTELVDFFQVLDLQAQTGDLSIRAPEEPFTEVGQIAKRYNQVLHRLEESTVAKDEFLHIMESMEEGLLLLDDQGIISPYYSIATEKLLGSKGLAGKTLAEVLLPLADHNQISPLGSYLDTLWNGTSVDYSDKLKLAAENPLQRIELRKHSDPEVDPSILAFKFIPIQEGRGSTRTTVRIMVLLHNITEEVLLSREVEKTQQEHETELAILYRLLHINMEDLKTFLSFSTQSLDNIYQLFDSKESENQKLQSLTKELHRFKQESAFLGIVALNELLEQFQYKIDVLSQSSTIRHGEFLHLSVHYTNLRRMTLRLKNLLGRVAEFKTAFQKASS
jgi:Amt family ammonium transporter